MLETLHEGIDLVHREAAYLDERSWDDWLALYRDDCEYWVPTWRDEDRLVEDPQREISHIYYRSRAGLEDRIVRIRSGMSPASTPLPRTTHLVGPVLRAAASDAGQLALRASWATHVYFPTSKRSAQFFGRSEFLLQHGATGLRIRRKKVLLMNDYIPGMLDIYCI